MRREWDFDFAPIHTYPRQSGTEADFVVSTDLDVDATTVGAALGDLSATVSVTPLLSAHPLFWYRVQLGVGVLRETVEQVLMRAGIKVRYVTSSVAGSQRTTRPADFDSARPRRPRDWRARTGGDRSLEEGPDHWFLGSLGVNLRRVVSGTGAGTRLAVIDNDAREIDALELEARVLIGVEEIPKASSHGSLAVGWAVGTGRRPSGRRFCGVAPDSSPRLYCVPKPGAEIFNVPVAIVRAVADGADVVLCATYLDGSTSPLLDDAFEFARRVGRHGRGTAIVLPPSREMSSAGSSVHASLSLGPAEPASDPRVFCVGPSARDGAWFLWRDRRGKLHPFANRGPAVRWLAPGDDMPYPFSDDERLTHAESSGAAAVAAGVLLLVIGQNPDLTVDELDELVTQTATPVDPEIRAVLSDLANTKDLLPLGVDADGHNARHGYGRMDAALAAAAARDPVSAVLIGMGEQQAALRWEEGGFERPYSQAFGRWAARVVLRDHAVRHALAAVVRTMRLWSSRAERASGQPQGALMRQVLIALRLLASSGRLGVSRLNDASEEGRVLVEKLMEVAPAAFDERVLRLVTELWEPPRSGVQSSNEPLGRPLRHDLMA